ncbi:hypothetical protein AZE42_12256 [Rhizopogon vesiculosus]|uniref:Uncharacterized protein n=1 Tax=Rhizopogon vesiculosus TaxID=180088 RepID=A0A1J8PY04_9AGAM|nr:hypothetical protein AZE42_12256 [Rhizopogon vesiculosus]
MVDPTDEVCPDFAAEFYDNIRGDIHTATGKPDAQIIDCLRQKATTAESKNRTNNGRKKSWLSLKQHLPA